MIELALYTKPGCHLCHEASVLLSRLQQEFPFTLREVDISQDPRLLLDYGDLIPVVEQSGKPLLAAPFGEATARKVLAQLFRAIL